MLRCAELGLSDEALSNMSMGMVYDMLIERANDKEDYPIKATQSDIYSLFGAPRRSKDIKGDANG